MFVIGGGGGIYESKGLWSTTAFVNGQKAPNIPLSLRRFLIVDINCCVNSTQHSAQFAYSVGDSKQTSFGAQEYGGAAVGTVVRSVWAELGPPQVGCAGGRGRTLQGHSPWNRWRLWNDEGRVKGRWKAFFHRKKDLIINWKIDLCVCVLLMLCL